MCKKRPGFLVDDKLNMNLQCDVVAEMANVILGYFNRGVVGIFQEVMVLLYNAFIRSYLEYYVQFWGPQFKKDIAKLD